MADNVLLLQARSGNQYELSRFGSEVFRSSPRQAALMIVVGTVSMKMGPYTGLMKRSAFTKKKRFPIVLRKKMVSS